MLRKGDLKLQLNIHSNIAAKNRRQANFKDCIGAMLLPEVEDNASAWLLLSE
jgi:hypothetical protein